MSYIVRSFKECRDTLSNIILCFFIATNIGYFYSKDCIIIKILGRFLDKTLFTSVPRTQPPTVLNTAVRRYGGSGHRPLSRGSRHVCCRAPDAVSVSGQQQLQLARDMPGGSDLTSARNPPGHSGVKGYQHCQTSSDLCTGAPRCLPCSSWQSVHTHPHARPASDALRGGTPPTHVYKITLRLLSGTKQALRRYTTASS